MKHWYAKPNNNLTEYVRTILILEGFSKPDTKNTPIFTNSTPIFFCKTDNINGNHENISQLTLFGKSPSDIWTLNKHTTIIAYFFKPFVTASIFNIPANKLSETPFDLDTWNPHKYTALKTQLIYAKDSITPTQFRRICQFQQTFGQLREKQYNKKTQIAPLAKWLK